MPAPNHHTGEPPALLGVSGPTNPATTVARIAIAVPIRTGRIAFESEGECTAVITQGYR